MYCSFYGIREKPFSITPDPKFLYLGKTHKEAFAHLLYGIRERGGFIVVTGEIGAGKTTLCRGLLTHLDEHTLVAFIFNPTLSALELLKSINEDFGIPSRGVTKKELIDELNQFLLEKRTEGKNTVLIIDEAQNLDGEVLEQIRLLSNLETDTEKLLQIILIGQPEFRHILEQPRLLQLNQRVTVRYHLRALSADETAEYIRHRLSVIDAEDKILFSPEAMKKIWRATKGVPRLINVLCDRALLAGYSTRRKHIDGRMIEQAKKEVLGGPAWGGSFRFVRRIRRGLLPASLLAALLVLLTVGLRTTLRESGRRSGAREGTSREQVAASEAGTVGVAKEVASPVQPSAMQSGPPEGISSDAVASEPGRSEDALILATALSDADGAPVSPESSRQGDLQGEETGPGEAESDNEVPAEPDLLGPGEPDRPGTLSSPQGAETLEGQEAVEEEFRRSFHDQALLETREDAFMAVLRRWDLALSDTEKRRLYRSAPDLYRAAKAFGFQCLRFRGNINRIRALNLPALMELRLGETLTKRYVALLTFEGAYGRIAPPLADGTSLVPLGVLESFWYGTAYVLWKDAWGGRRYLAEGMKGETVGQLQASLKKLGYYRQAPSGVFDGKTVEAVRAFQRDHFLDEDGILGPQTRILLYRALSQFRMPRLEEAT
jgi:general secretion pathway protein A